MTEEATQNSYYEIGGKKYPRVTHVLKVIEKPGLARWRGRVGNSEADRIANEGAAIGTEFHGIVADINRGEHLKRGWQPPGKFRNMAYAYIDWLHHEVDSVEAVEQLVYSDEHSYAGTLDLLVKFKNDPLPSIVDVKTSNYVSADWPLQLAAYRKALREQGTDTYRRVIIRVPKTGDGEPELYDYRNHEEDEAMWLNILQLWNWMRDDKERQKQAFMPAGLE